MAVILFLCTPGESKKPADVTHVIIDRSVKFIPRRAFQYRTQLLSVEAHDGLEKVEG